MGRTPGRAWVSRRTLLVFWAVWLPCMGFLLVTPSFSGAEVWAAHEGEPALKLSLVNGSRHEAALVIESEAGGERRVDWLHDLCHLRSETGRPAGPLRLSVVTSSFAAGAPTTGERELLVPSVGLRHLAIADDGTSSVRDSFPVSGATGAADHADAAGAADGTQPAAAAAVPPGVEALNASSRRARVLFLADDGTLFEQLLHGDESDRSLPRAFVPGEHLHASWELAAPVTDGGTPLRVEQPGDLDLEVRVFPDGRWEISAPSLLARARLRCAMFLAVFTGN